MHRNDLLFVSSLWSQRLHRHIQLRSHLHKLTEDKCRLSTSAPSAGHAGRPRVDFGVLGSYFPIVKRVALSNKTTKRRKNRRNFRRRIPPRHRHHLRRFLHLRVAQHFSRGGCQAVAVFSFLSVRRCDVGCCRRKLTFSPQTLFLPKTKTLNVVETEHFSKPRTPSTHS